jgi:glucose/arabinose dehydrogenase
MPNPIPTLFTTSLANIILVAEVFALVFISMAYQTPDLMQYDHSHFAKALTLKYPDVGLPSPQGPTILHHGLKAEVVFRGLEYPTSMDFLGPDDILVTEKDEGTVRRIQNSTELQQPLLNVSVATDAHRGMLGIAVAHSLTADHLSNHKDPSNLYSNITYVFLYYTQPRTNIGDDVTEGKQPPSNLLYRYELINGKLANPKLLLDLPATPGAIGNGGKVVIGPDDNVYLTIGSVGINGHVTKAQNIQNGSDPDGTSGILRVSQDGQPILPGILGDEFPLNIYYSYGMWNSFGLAFDPITKSLWDTQIGLSFGDEINMVEPGFNSGYDKIDGMWLRSYNTSQTEKSVAPLHPNELVDFGGKGKYHAPQFAWFHKVVPTGITFLDSEKMGNSYKNDMFVSDAKYGNIYHFKLNAQRTGLLLPAGQLADGVANSSDSLSQITFGKGFGAITDLKANPHDGHLYVLTFDDTRGTIFRIVPIDKEQTSGG